MKATMMFMIAVLLMLAMGCSRDEPAKIVNPPVVETPTSIKMNELYAKGTAADPDWVELYNPGTSPVSLNGYKIYDQGGQTGSKPKLEFPAEAVIPAKGYYVIVTDVDTDAGFGMSSGGEDVWLENDSSRVIDQIKFLPHETNQTYGRYPDGDSTWQVLNTMTRGASNQQ